MKKKMKLKLVLWASPFLIFVFFLFVLLSVLTSGISPTSNSVGDGSTLIQFTYDRAKVQAFLDRYPYLKDKLPDFEQIAQKYTIDPILMIAIIIQETGGSSEALTVHNNPSGQMNPGGGLMHFSSLLEGLEMTGKTLNNLINERKLDTIEKLGSVYCPVGATNDPMGLNVHWVPNIKGFVEQMGGMSFITFPSLGDGQFIVPVKNPVITSEFSDRINPVTGQAESHKGIDFGQPTGSEIAAIQGGTVVYAAYDGAGFQGYGKAVMIQHSESLYTLYGHMIEISATTGQQVTQGQVIGLVGSTGQSSGPHLHLEVRHSQFGNQVNPRPLLPL